jgi:hypothetical protein
MKGIRRFVAVFARLTALAGTTALLIATSPAQETPCAFVPPATFRASGTCGPGGIIVVDHGIGGYQLTIHNAAALGLPPLVSSSSNNQGGPRVVHQVYCPTGYADGGWSVDFPLCGADAGTAPTDADARSDGDVPPSDAGAPTGGLNCIKECEAALSDAGALLFTCTGIEGETRCQSRLTVVQ